MSKLSTIMYGPLDDLQYLLDGSTEMTNTDLQAAICRVLEEVRRLREEVEKGDPQ